MQVAGLWHAAPLRTSQGGGCIAWPRLRARRLAVSRVMTGAEDGRHRSTRFHTLLPHNPAPRRNTEGWHLGARRGPSGTQTQGESACMREGEWPQRVSFPQSRSPRPPEATGGGGACGVQ